MSDDEAMSRRESAANKVIDHYDSHGAIGELSPNHSLNLSVGLDINGSRCLVQHQDLASTEESALMMEKEGTSAPPRARQRGVAYAEAHELALSR